MERPTWNSGDVAETAVDELYRVAEAMREQVIYPRSARTLAVSCMTTYAMSFLIAAHANKDNSAGESFKGRFLELSQALVLANRGDYHQLQRAILDTADFTSHDNPEVSEALHKLAQHI